jgi:hypothetical protein
MNAWYERWPTVSPCEKPLARKPIPGRPREFTRDQEALLRARLEAAPDATVGERCAWWAEQQGHLVSVTTMWRAIRRLGWTHSLAASEREEEARKALQVADDAWQKDAHDPEGRVWWASIAQPPTGERWLVVRTAQGEERARATLAQQLDKARERWEKTIWHLRNQRFAREFDARAALAAQLKTCPARRVVEADINALPKHRRPGRPRKDTVPDRLEWHVQATHGSTRRP